MISMKPVDIPPSSQVHGAASEGCRTDTAYELYVVLRSGAAIR